MFQAEEIANAKAQRLFDLEVVTLERGVPREHWAHPKHRVR